MHSTQGVGVNGQGNGDDVRLFVYSKHVRWHMAYKLQWL